MNNAASIDILKLAVERLSNEVSSKMLGINLILSEPAKTDNQVDKIVMLIKGLSSDEAALNTARELYAQALRMTLEGIAKEQASNQKSDFEDKKEEKS